MNDDYDGDELEGSPVDCGNCGGVIHSSEDRCPGCGWENEEAE